MPVPGTRWCVEARLLLLFYNNYFRLSDSIYWSQILQTAALLFWGEQWGQTCFWCPTWKSPPAVLAWVLCGGAQVPLVSDANLGDFKHFFSWSLMPGNAPRIQSHQCTAAPQGRVKENLTCSNGWMYCGGQHRATQGWAMGLPLNPGSSGWKPVHYSLSWKCSPSSWARETVS